MEIQFSVVFVGLNSSGKTTIINSLKNNKQQYFPTAGFNIDYINIQKIPKPILCYDCSGSGMHRVNWKTFYSQVDAVIFIIDASDIGRFKYAKQQLIQITKDKIVLQKKIPICIMLNKSDKKLQTTKQIFYAALEIERLQSAISNKIYLKQTSGYTKEGLQQCFMWLYENK